MGKYTQGPWIAGKKNNGNDVVRAGKPRRGYDDCILASVGDPTGDNHGEDNARLIAAAPDLLAALEGLADCAGLTWLDGYKNELDAAMRTAREAISRALGR